MKSNRFDLGFCILDEQTDHVFLSVTDGFEHGPGIHRDGISEPWMLDPHAVQRIRKNRNVHEPKLARSGTQNPRSLRPGTTTTNPYVQRAGTWTIYHHLKHFHDALGDRWTIVGAQSNGDLTMNPWHIAFVGHSHLHTRRREICGLLLVEDHDLEPIDSRVYRCLVKWIAPAAERLGLTYEFVDLRLKNDGVAFSHPAEAENYGHAFSGLPEYDLAQPLDLSRLVEFALAGKPIIERKQELPLHNVVDRFQDVRHIFNIPAVPAAHGMTVNLGEYQLFHYLNERRAALFAPILIDLNVPKRFEIQWLAMARELRTNRRFENVEHHSPTQRGQFRWYPGDNRRPRIEIFFQPAVYPFGALGVREHGASADERRTEVVSLSCGGLSGRVGNTLQGVSRMMYDFFRCGDAVILDEGLDVCLIDNQNNYSNEDLLHKVWSFTKRQLDADHDDSLLKTPPAYSRDGLKDYPLNRELVTEVARAFKDTVDHTDVFRVCPGRSQIRSMLIFAKRRPSVP